MAVMGTITTRAAAPLESGEMTTFDLQVEPTTPLEQFEPGARVDVQLFEGPGVDPIELVEGARVREVHRGYTAKGLGPGTDLPPHLTLLVSNEQAVALGASALKGRLVARLCPHGTESRSGKGQIIHSPPIDGPAASRAR